MEFRQLMTYVYGGTCVSSEDLEQCLQNHLDVITGINFFFCFNNIYEIFFFFLIRQWKTWWFIYTLCSNVPWFCIRGILWEKKRKTDKVRRTDRIKEIQSLDSSPLDIQDLIWFHILHRFLIFKERNVYLYHVVSISRNKIMFLCDLI